MIGMSGPSRWRSSPSQWPSTSGHGSLTVAPCGGDEHAVERASRVERREHHLQQPLDRVLFDHAIRHRPGGEDRHGLGPLVVERVQHPAHFVMRAGQPLANRFAGDQQVPARNAPGASAAR